MPKTTTPLSEREQRFIAEYLKDANGTQAAIRAGYSARSARKTACEMLQKPRVKAAVRLALKKQEQRTLISADQVLLDIQSIGNQALRAKDFAQALRSRELLGKRFKLFTDRMEVIDTTPRAERLQAARARKKKAPE